jgi:kinetochore protein NDC80
VFDFLTETEYPQRASTKALLGGASAKDFQAMLTHIARTLDCHYMVSGKLEDEVAALAKALNYPFTPSKTAIATAGAAHSWPPLLGLLVWLVDLCRYHACLRAKQEEEEAALEGEMAAGRAAGAAGTDAHFWWYLRTAYSSYLAGADEAVERLEEGIRGDFSEAARAVEAEAGEAERALAGAQAEAAALAAGAAALPALRAGAADLSGDCGRLRAALEEMLAYAASLGRKLAEKRAECGAAEEAGERGRAELQKLRAAVAGQEMSVEELRRARAACSALREQQEVLAAGRGGAEAEAEAAGAAVRRALGALEARVRAYHDRARGLQLLPKGSKYSNGVDYSLVVDEGALERAAAPSFGAAEGCVAACGAPTALAPTPRPQPPPPPHHPHPLSGTCAPRRRRCWATT